LTNNRFFSILGTKSYFFDFRLYFFFFVHKFRLEQRSSSIASTPTGWTVGWVFDAFVQAVNVGTFFALDISDGFAGGADGRKVKTLNFGTN
jgi:hypothetical protein